MRRQATLGCILVGCLMFLFCANTASGQAVYGSIIGTVTDPQGNAIVGGKVTVTSLTKTTVFEGTTNESGNYTVTHLIPDDYKIRIEAPGFKGFEIPSVRVDADAAVKIDAQLQVGGVTQTVEVTGEVPQLKTDRADVAIQFNEKYVSELPLLNRNFTNLQLLSPGTQKLVGWSHAATENPQGAQQIFVNGQHFSGTAFELDGTDNQDPILGIIVVNPNLDAVQESKISLGNFDAEFGKAVAGIVTIQTKSGTNDFHGTGFYYWRGDGQQACDPFSQCKPDSSHPGQRLPLPSASWKQFGGAGGGPIIKNKLFFFADYQGTKQTSGITNTLTIPTAHALTTCLLSTGFCDLSEYQPQIGNGVAGDPTNYIYDPASSPNIDGSGRGAFCGASGIVFNPTPATCPTPFLIPVGRLSAQALNVLKLFPTPTISPSGGGVCTSATPNCVTNNFFGSGSGPYDQKSFDTRIDWNGPHGYQIFGRFSLDYFSLSGKGVLGKIGGVGDGPGGLAGASIVHNYSMASGFTKAIGTTLLTDFRFGWFKYNPQTHYADQTATPMDGFGIPCLNTAVSGTCPNVPGPPTSGGLSAFFMDGVISNFGDGLNVGRCNCPLTESEQQFQFVNNWTKIRGNHSLKFGGDIRYAKNLRIPSDANRTGQLNFNRGITANSGNGGLDLATFLLGDVSFMDRFVSTSLNAAERQKRWFFYGQDVWRITPKFTFNYGLRWETYFPESVNGKGHGGFANLQEGIIRVAGFGKYGLNGNVDNTWKAVAPRIGAAYQLDSKTVLRMGYGRSFDIGVFGSNFGHVVTQNLPVLANQNIFASTTTPGASDNRFPAFTLASGPPGFNPPVVPSDGVLPLKGPNNNVDPRIRPTVQRLPTLDAWNATVQRQVTPTMNVEVAYIGNKGTHVFAGAGPAYNANPVIAVSGTSIDGKFAPPANLPQNNRRPFNLNGVPAFTYPSFGGITCCDTDLGNYFGNDASSNYNALQIKAEKRFTKGLQFLAHYTFAHANNYDSDYYAADPRVAYGPDSFTRTHVFVASTVYELPVGKGKMFMSDASRVMDLIVGGWQLTNTLNWSGGLPWTPSYAECGQDKDAGPCRPDKGKGSFSVGAHTDASGNIFWFTPISALAIGAPPGTDFCTVARPTGNGFNRPACGTIGNIGRNSFRGPHAFFSDMALAKNFNFTEKIKAQFRLDAYNVFNHKVLGFNSNQGNTCIDCSGNAGQITSLEGDASPGSPNGMRQLQFGLRFTF